MICTTYKFTSISCPFPQLNYVTFVLFIYLFFCFSLGIWMLWRIVSLDPQVLKSPITTPATKHPTLLRSHQHYLPQTKRLHTWMSAMVPDSAIDLTGLSVHRSDRTKELTAKSRDGGVCFYINNFWRDERNLHPIKSFWSPDLEYASVSTILATEGIYSDHNHSCLHSPSSQHRPGTQGTVWEYK